MCWEASAQYPADRRTPAMARRFCAQTIDAVLGDAPGVADLITDLTVITSELVTNAVNASTGPIGFEIAVHRDHVHLGVTDDAPGEPVARAATVDESNGRGLAITAELSRGWGVERSGPIKRVWADVVLDGALTRELQCSVAAGAGSR